MTEWLFMLSVASHKLLPPINAMNQSISPQVELAYRQAIAYGQDLARIYEQEKAHREQLEVAVQMMQAIFTNAPMPSVVLDQDLCIQDVNLAFARLIKREAALDSLLHENIAGALHDTHIAAAINQIAETGANEGVIPFTSAEGQRRYVNISVARLHPKSKHSWILVFHDESESLRRQRQKIESIGSMARELCVSLQQIVAGAQTLEVEQAPQNSSVIVKKIVTDGVHLQAQLQKLVELTAAHEGDPIFDSVVETSDGTVTNHRSNHSNEYSNVVAEMEQLRQALDAKHRQSIAYAQDLTAVYRKLQLSHLELQDINQKLERANELKSNFLGLVSHELRTPFSVVTMNLQILRRATKSLLTPPQQEMLDDLQKSIGTAHTVVERLINHAQLLSRQAQLNLAPIDLVAELQETLETGHAFCLNRKLHLKAVLPATLPMQNGDAALIREAVWELLHNAIKVSARGGAVGLKLDRDAEFARITVVDHGPGIPKEAQATIFEAFAQQADHLKRGAEGLGIGLTVVRFAALAHGGQVTVESELGKGSAFTLWLPLKMPSRTE